MKKCNATAFNRCRKRGGLQSLCRSCTQEAFRRYYARSKDVVIQRKKDRVRVLQDRLLLYLLDHPCIVCGESDPVVLDFDHRDQKNKRTEIYQIVRAGTSVAILDAEIEKCDVRCSNCHRRRTAVQIRSYRLRGRLLTALRLQPHEQ